LFKNKAAHKEHILIKRELTEGAMKGRNV
jgi:hypothetical protein